MGRQAAGSLSAVAIHFWQNFNCGSVADVLAVVSRPPLKELHHSSLRPMRSAASRDDQEAPPTTKRRLLGVTTGKTRNEYVSPGCDSIADLGAE
jgi:hypothetical protein